MPPFVSGDTTIGLEAAATERVAPPFDDTHVAVYPVIGLPPLLAGALNVTDTAATPPTATPMPGAPGAVAAPAGMDMGAAKLNAAAANTMKARADTRREQFVISALRSPKRTPTGDGSINTTNHSVEERTIRQRVSGRPGHFVTSFETQLVYCT